MKWKRVVFSLLCIASLAAVPVERGAMAAPFCSVLLDAYTSNPFDNWFQTTGVAEAQCGYDVSNLEAEKFSPGSTLTCSSAGPGQSLSCIIYWRYTCPGESEYFFPNVTVAANNGSVSETVYDYAPCSNPDDA